MSAIFSILLVMSAVGIWYFIKKQPNKKYRNVVIGLAIVFGLLAGATAPKAEPTPASKAPEVSKDTPKPEKKKKPQNTKITTLSDDSIKNVIHINNHDIKVTSVSGNYTNDENSSVQINTKIDQGLTAKTAEIGMLGEVADIWKTLKTKTPYSQLGTINIWVSAPIQDAGGNTNSEVVIKTSISGPKLDSLNTDNFFGTMVPNFADSFWKHPAFPNIN